MRPERKDPKENAFLRKILAHLRSEGVRVRFYNKKTLGLACTGSFDGANLAVAVQAAFWFEVTLHEYCHFLQKLEGSPWFSASGSRSWVRFEGWLSGQEVHPDRLMLDAREIARCELDCEQRVMRFVRRHRFSTIDPETYVRAANAYVYSYEAMRLLRKEATQQSVYRVQEIMDMMPSTFIRKDRVHRLPDGYLELFAKHCVL
jgi:hypothetical protein